MYNSDQKQIINYVYKPQKTIYLYLCGYALSLRHFYFSKRYISKWVPNYLKL